ACDCLTKGTRFKKGEAANYVNQRCGTRVTDRNRKILCARWYRHTALVYPRTAVWEMSTGLLTQNDAEFATPVFRQANTQDIKWADRSPGANAQQKLRNSTPAARSRSNCVSRTGTSHEEMLVSGEC